MIKFKNEFLQSRGTNPIKKTRSETILVNFFGAKKKNHTEKKLHEETKLESSLWSLSADLKNLNNIL